MPSAILSIRCASDWSIPSVISTLSISACNRLKCKLSSIQAKRHTTDHHHRHTKRFLWQYRVRGHQSDNAKCIHHAYYSIRWEFSSRWHANDSRQIVANAWLCWIFHWYSPFRLTASAKATTIREDQEKNESTTNLMQQLHRAKLQIVSSHQSSWHRTEYVVVAARIVGD